MGMVGQELLIILHVLPVVTACLLYTRSMACSLNSSRKKSTGSFPLMSGTTPGEKAEGEPGGGGRAEAELAGGRREEEAELSGGGRAEEAELGGGGREEAELGGVGREEEAELGGVGSEEEVELSGVGSEEEAELGGGGRVELKAGEVELNAGAVSEWALDPADRGWSSRLQLVFLSSVAFLHMFVITITNIILVLT